MKLLKNIVFQYTVITFLVILFISITLGTILSQRITNYTIQTHIEAFPHVIQLIASDHLQVYTFLKSPAGTNVPEDVKSFLNELLSFGAISRIKVWGKDGTILWSDKVELSHEKSVEIICEEKGKHFDPLIVEAFLKKEKDFYMISEQMADKVT